MRAILLPILALAVAASVLAQPADNIALHKPYTLSPAPAYAHCTDPGDATQLTDGAYVQGYFWTQPGTVGWSGASPILITIDLGSDQPIRGLSYNTAAGAAGVAWPQAIYLLTAGEDNAQHEAGELVGLSAANGIPPAEGYSAFRFQTGQLHTHGRYITLAVCGTPYIFCDEIEIYAGDPAWVNEPLQGAIITDPKHCVERVLLREAVRRRILRDAASVRKCLDTSGIVEAERAAIAADLDAINAEALTISGDFPADFKAILPVIPLDARVFAAQARLWRAMKQPRLTAWAANLWDYLDLTAQPAATSPSSVSVTLMQNEYRAGAFNLANAGDAPAECAIAFEGLPGGATPPYIRVHEVQWTDTSEGTPVAAALPDAPLRDGLPTVTVLPGLPRQVWLTFHPTDLPAGNYAGNILIQSVGETLRVPVELRLDKRAFPARAALHFGGWDYLNMPAMYEATPENKPALIALLREHGFDSPWATSSAMPRGTHDAEGAMTAPPDTANFDTWVAQFPDAAQYLVFAAVGDTFNGLALDTPAFARAVGDWARFWARHAAEKGIAPEKMGVLLVDEPSQPAMDAVIIAWAKALHAAATGIRVWEDPIYSDMTKADPELLSHCDTLCPNRGIFLHEQQSYRDAYLARKATGATLDFYSCSGPVRTFDPYRYYLLQAWHCWRYGAQSSFFWAMADGAGASSWNEYVSPRAAFTPLFIDKITVVTGKHLEACREGIEDYEYLRLLDTALHAAAQDPQRADAVTAAKKTMAEAIEEVCAGESEPMRWSKEDTDHAASTRARIRILDALDALEAGQ